MTRILDTTPTFLEFARKAFPEGPLIREMLCEERYHGAFPEVFADYFDRFSKDGLRGIVWELTQVRKRVEEGAPVVARIIDEVEPAVRDLLGVEAAPDPQHVLMVGTLATNASVGRVAGEVAVFHCLEWYQGAEGARVLVAHEDAHAWHELLLREPPPSDLAWTAFYEGLAMQVSRAVVPDRPDGDYFWYGVSGFDDWLPWCQEHRGALLREFADALDDPDAAERYFGSGFVQGRWRVGYFIADEVVRFLGRSPSELVRLTPDEARESVGSGLKTLTAA